MLWDPVTGVVPGVAIDHGFAGLSGSSSPETVHSRCAAITEA